MNPVNRTIALLAVGAVALTGIPMALASQDFVLVEHFAIALPIILILEFIIYLVVTLVLNPRMGFLQVVGLAIALLAFRALASLIGGSVALGIHGSEVVPDPLLLWGAHPFAALLQVIVLLAMAPGALALLSGESDAAAVPSRGGPAVSAKDTRATGPIQVFSYEELAGTLRKVPGLEGFLVVSSEGLVVWRDLPLRLEMDALAARLFSSERSLGSLMDNSSLARQKRVLIQTREHTLCIQELDANFGLILVYGGRVSLSDIDERLEVFAQTVRVFLQWKYPGLIVLRPTAVHAAG